MHVDTLQELLRQWQLAQHSLLEKTRFNELWRCHGLDNTSQYVLKLGPPALLRDEILVMQQWEGRRGLPGVVEAAPDYSALLMHFYEGDKWTLGDAASDGEEIGRMVRRLSRMDMTRPLPKRNLDERVTEALSRFNGEHLMRSDEKPTAEQRLNELRDLARTSRATRQVVHGDLLAKNIIRTPEGKLQLIDPLPCIGERAFDIACWALDCGVEIEDRARAAAKVADASWPRTLAWIRAMAPIQVYYWRLVEANRDSEAYYLLHR